MGKSITVLSLDSTNVRLKYGKIEDTLMLGIAEQKHSKPIGYEEYTPVVTGLLACDVLLQFQNKDMIDNMIKILEKLKSKY